MLNNKGNITLTLGLGLGLTLVLLWLVIGQADTTWADPGIRYVSLDGNDGTQCDSIADRCRTVQRAIDVASAFDEIWVATGTYTDAAGPVASITKTVTLLGGWNGGFTTRDPNGYPTTLDAQRNGRVVYVSGNINPTVDGFTITGGNASNAPTGAGRGGGIYSAGATPIIANNVITNNIAYTSTSSRGYGGGIYVSNPPGVAVITGNQVLSNVAGTSYEAYGGGIYLESASSAQVVNNNVLSNTASITGGLGFGGGITLASGSSTTLTGNRVEGNVAQAGLAPTLGSEGGGVYCSGSDDVTISYNLVQYNTASIPANGQGGGIGIQRCDRLTVAGNTLQGNVGSASTTTGGGRGGGLGAYASRDLMINTNRVLSNTASLSQFGWGGGLYLLRNTTFTMTNNIVAANDASYRGGGLAFETGVVEPVAGTLVHNTFAANDRGSGDGRIAIHLNDPYVTLVLTNNLIYSHTYGVYAATNSTATLYTTLFYINSSGDTGGPGTIVNTNPITGEDPLLVADYHLGPGSAALDRGVDAGVTTDIDGDWRDSSPDLGADELAPAPGSNIYLPLILKTASP
jgi:hypothetical protein